MLRALVQVLLRVRRFCLLLYDICAFVGFCTIICNIYPWAPFGVHAVRALVYIFEDLQELLEEFFFFY